MSHEINITNGIASFATAREHAWHRLGTVLDDRFTAEQAMEYAHLGGWNVRKAPLTTAVLGEDGVTAVEVPNRFATIRTNPITRAPEYLGVVGDGYRIIQNEETAELLNALVDEGGAHFETAGALRGGRQVFLSIKLPNGVSVGGVDQIDTYIVAMNGHDGSLAFRFVVTPVRVVCANTQAAALQSAKATFSVWHTRNAANTILEAREALDLTFTYLDGFADEAERMVNTPMTTSEFVAFTKRIFGSVDEDAAPRTITTATRRDSALMQLFHDADTNANIRGTRWAAYQAVTEYLDHEMPVNGEKSATQREAARALRTVTAHKIKTAKELAFASL